MYSSHHVLQCSRPGIFGPTLYFHRHLEPHGPSSFRFPVLLRIEHKHKATYLYCSSHRLADTASLPSQSARLIYNRQREESRRTVQRLPGKADGMNTVTSLAQYASIPCMLEHGVVSRGLS
jgi:hypothetical protein